MAKNKSNKAAAKNTAPTAKQVKEWKLAGMEYAADQLAGIATTVSKQQQQQIEGCAIDLMGGNDEAAAYAVEGMREVIESQNKAVAESVAEVAEEKVTEEPKEVIKFVTKPKCSPEATERFKQKWHGKSKGERIALKIENAIKFVAHLDKLIAPLPIEHVEDAHQLVRGASDILKAARDKVAQLPRSYRKAGGAVQRREELQAGDMVTLRTGALKTYQELFGDVAKGSFRVEEIKAGGKYAVIRFEGVGLVPLKTGLLNKVA